MPSPTLPLLIDGPANIDNKKIKMHKNFFLHFIHRNMFQYTTMHKYGYRINMHPCTSMITESNTYPCTNTVTKSIHIQHIKTYLTYYLQV